MDAEEVWKKIPGIDLRYEVSNRGRVKTLAHTAPAKSRNGNLMMRRYPARIIALCPAGDGYFCFYPITDGARKILYVHQAVALAFIPNPKNLPEVNHDDGDKSNNTPGNLEWATSSGNHLHGFAKLGRINGRARLTPSDAREIRTLTITDDEIALRFGIVVKHVRAIKRGDKWKHVA